MLHWFDICIIFAFIFYAISSGWRNKDDASKNLEEYFLAGRSLPGWKAGLSMAATQFAADTPLMVTGMIATAGIFALWQLWIYALAFLMMGFVLASSWRKAEVLTDAELTEFRYGHTSAAVLRGVKAIYFGTIFNCTVLAIVLFAAAKIAEPFLHWDQWLHPTLFTPFVDFVHWVGTPVSTLSENDPQVWIKTANNFISILAIVLVTTFYSATGGLRSVVATDVVQFGIMMLGTLIFTVIVVSEVGGLGTMIDKLKAMEAAKALPGITSDQVLAFTPDQAKEAGLALLLVFALQWLLQLNSDGTGYLAQRSMACRSAKDAKIAAVVFTLAQILLRSLLWLPLGVGLLVMFAPDPGFIGDFKASREDTFVKGMALLPVGVKGLMVTGMLAALASTVDTHLNWGSSYWTNDIYKRFICQSWLKKEPSESSLVWVARAANILILSLGLLIATQLASIEQAWQTSLLLGAGMGVPLILRWLWWRMNAWAEISAILVSLIFAPILLFGIGATIIPFSCPTCKQVVVKAKKEAVGKEKKCGKCNKVFKLSQKNTKTNLGKVEESVFQKWSPKELEALRLLVMGFISTLAVLLAVFIRGPEDREKLKAFYEKAQPVGFWEPVARDAGDENYSGPAKLLRALGAMFISGFSVFCILVGIGSWVMQSPAPTWFPWSTVWIILLIVVGLALCPVWIKLGFGKEE